MVVADSGTYQHLDQLFMHIPPLVTICARQFNHKDHDSLSVAIPVIAIGIGTVYDVRHVATNVQPATTHIRDAMRAKYLVGEFVDCVHLGCPLRQSVTPCIIPIGVVDLCHCGGNRPVCWDERVVIVSISWRFLSVQTPVSSALAIRLVEKWIPAVKGCGSSAHIRSALSPRSQCVYR